MKQTYFQLTVKYVIKLRPRHPRKAERDFERTNSTQRHLHYTAKLRIKITKQLGKKKG